MLKGIVFTLIIVRIGLGLSTEAQQRSGTSTFTFGIGSKSNNSARITSTPREVSNGSHPIPEALRWKRPGRAEDFPMEPLEINVTTVQKSDMSVRGNGDGESHRSSIS
jgi:hypothetical protein